MSGTEIGALRTSPETNPESRSTMAKGMRISSIGYQLSAIGTGASAPVPRSD